VPRIVAAAVFALISMVACTGGGESLPSGQGRVVRVVDGDTVIVRLGAVDEPVRLLGIDTPESVAPNRPVECYGKEASKRTAALLPAGTRVRLERDVEPRDRFDRLLAYVVRVDDATFVNLALLEEGYAELLVIEPNHAHAVAFSAAASDARTAGRGLWSACQTQ
jgi:micrococcal nuclease